MRKILSTFACTLLIFCFSCKEAKKAPEGPTQMEQVMAIHDEVMPKMGELGKLVGQLKTKVDTTAVGQEYESAMRDLQSAHKSMMDWERQVHDFARPLLKRRGCDQSRDPCNAAASPSSGTLECHRC